jgi:hypothetical protein
MIPLFEISLKFDDEIRILNFDIFVIFLFSIVFSCFIMSMA